VIVVAVIVQSVFRLEMNQNEVFFYFLKIIFDISTSKRFEIIYFFNLKQKKSKFLSVRFTLCSQTI